MIISNTLTLPILKRPVEELRTSTEAVSMALASHLSQEGGDCPELVLVFVRQHLQSPLPKSRKWLTDIVNSERYTIQEIVVNLEN